MNTLITCLFIFFARILDVSLGTLKTLFVIRGNKKLSFILGLIEITVWYIVVNKALGDGKMEVLLKKN